MRDGALALFVGSTPRELHRRRQAIAALRNRFDDAMGRAIVAEMMAQLGDAVRHRLIGDDDVAPHLRVQRLPRNDLAGAFRQAHEHVHDPGFEMHLGAAAHDAVLAGLDEALADPESGLQLLGGECHRGSMMLPHGLGSGTGSPSRIHSPFLR